MKPATRPTPEPVDDNARNQVWGDGMSGIKVGDVFWIRPFTGFPLFGRVRVVDPGAWKCTTYPYLVEVVGRPDDGWWMDENGKPNNHVSAHVRVK